MNNHYEKYRAYYEKYRDNNREAYNARQRIINFENKIRVFLHYSNGNLCCACCGENRVEFLTIDHINGGGKNHRKIIGTGNRMWKWFIKNKFPKGYQVLCMNCNFAKGLYGVCAHVKRYDPVQFAIDAGIVGVR